MPDEALKKISIVYAEDDPIIRENISAYLRRRVEHVHEAENGKIALDLISEHSPDIILTDLEMPVMGGIEMIQCIRDEYNGIHPIIVMTGYNDPQHHTDLADHYVYKPIDMQILLEKILCSARDYKIIDV